MLVRQAVLGGQISAAIHHNATGLGYQIDQDMSGAIYNTLCFRTGHADISPHVPHLWSVAHTLKTPCRTTTAKANLGLKLIALRNGEQERMAIGSIPGPTYRLPGRKPFSSSFTALQTILHATRKSILVSPRATSPSSHMTCADSAVLH